MVPVRSHLRPQLSHHLVLVHNDWDCNIDCGERLDFVPLLSFPVLPPLERHSVSPCLYHPAQLHARITTEDSGKRLHYLHFPARGTYQKRWSC